PRGAPGAAGRARLALQTGENLVDTAELLGELRVDALLLLDHGCRSALEERRVGELALARADPLLEALPLPAQPLRLRRDVEKPFERDRHLVPVRPAPGCRPRRARPAA